MTEQHREIIELAVFDLESKSGVRWGPEYMEEFAAALRAMLAENAALKANDALDAMWAALAEYQPFADRDGHGDTWRAMCEERTSEFALSAWVDAESRSHAEEAARSAARAIDADDAELRAARAANAKREVQNAVVAIRKAKEAQR
jgi:hypothetical protein